MTQYLHAYKASCLEPTRENKKIYAAIIDRINYLKPSSVLEIGSGMGMLGDAISKTGIRYVGLEPDEAQLSLCRKRYPELNVIEGSCYESPEKYGLGEFDLVFSTDVIEHLYLPRHLVNFKIAHVKKGGYVLTCTPEFGSYWKNLLYSITNKWDVVHSPWWDGGHIKFFSRKSLRMILEEQDFVDFQWGTITNVNIPILPMSMICICRRS
jgi:2-polyprenyl-3-methyl-5-hydroxy-6-metoxy-1,4-benzoquinol methylase